MSLLKIASVPPAAVAPSAKDMTLPLMVMNVIPADKQPITEAVVNSAVKLGADRKLGVKKAQINNAPSTTARVVAIGERASPAKWACICSQLRDTDCYTLTMPSDCFRSDALCRPK